MGLCFSSNREERRSQQRTFDKSRRNGSNSGSRDVEPPLDASKIESASSPTGSTAKSRSVAPVAPSSVPPYSQQPAPEPPVSRAPNGRPEPFSRPGSREGSQHRQSQQRQIDRDRDPAYREATPPQAREGGGGDAEGWYGDEEVVATTESGFFAPASLRVFGFEELRRATQNFRRDSKLGEGGFGAVYRGWIEDGSGAEDVAVKILNPQGLQGHKEWKAEVSFLGQMRHPNLVRLVGYCMEEEQRLLVYEFMCNGSLETHLFRRSARVLPWNLRMSIALGAATGLAYLHEASKQVIYRDFKTSNILLNEDFTAKLSDFGLAKAGPEGGKSHVSTRVMGTYGYAAPEYVMTGHLTAKSDVYSFGVVLLEIITGRRAMDRSLPPDQHNLVDWSRQFFSDRRKLFKLLDPRLEGMYSIKGAQKAAVLAQTCLHRDPKARPTMSTIVQALSLLQDLQDFAAGQPQPVPGGPPPGPPGGPGMGAGGPAGGSRSPAGGLASGAPMATSSNSSSGGVRGSRGSSGTPAFPGSGSDGASRAPVM